MTVSEVAAYLRAHDKYLILTHRRPDGDTLGCAAALCAMLRQMGKTAGILYNRETTEHFESYVEQYWVADDFDYETVVSVDLAALLCRVDLVVNAAHRVQIGARCLADRAHASSATASAMAFRIMARAVS